MRSNLARALRRRLGRPISLGDLRRTSPISSHWGADRGQPIDRHYIEQFLEAHSADIRGRVLEVMDSRYTERYGTGVVTTDVLDVDASNERATIVADLMSCESVPSGSFDCLILTQTLQFVYDLRAAIREAHRMLSPGGVLLVTVPAVSKVDRTAGVRGDYWRFTRASCHRLFSGVFGPDIRVGAHGNVLAAIAFLAGLAREDLTDEELDVHDDFFPVLVTVRAVKDGSAP